LAILLSFGREIHKWFGVVTSFRGTDRTNRWLLGLSPLNQIANNGRFSKNLNAFRISFHQVINLAAFQQVALQIFELTVAIISQQF
jgi:hypothetical protein